MFPIKVTLIGAGSPFAFHVVSDMCRRPELGGSTIALVDIDDEALELSARICSRMVAQAGADLLIESATDRRALLPGSDFVLNSISTGEPWARERDVAIGEEHGIYQPTSQTVGPAGFMRGLRVIPHAAAIAWDVAELCPEAMVLNLANPLSAVCRAMIREAGVNVIGLCEAWKLSLPVLAEALRVPEASLVAFPAGINHLTFLLSLHHQGQEVLDDAIARLYRPKYKRLLARVPVSREVYETFGLWPMGTEDHVAEFFNYFLTPETEGGARYNLKTRHTTEEQVQARWQERRERAEGKRPVDDLLAPSGESAVEIMAGLVGAEEPKVQIVNIPNESLIDNMPENAIVEVPAQVGPYGVRGLKVGPLPQPLAHLLATRSLQQELMVNAALSGDRQIALQGLLLDAQITSLRVAREILEQSLEANSEWLPSFRDK